MYELIVELIGTDNGKINKQNKIKHSCRMLPGLILRIIKVAHGDGHKPLTCTPASSIKFR